MNTKKAKLYYLIGPSGAGKDTLLAAIRGDTSAAPGLRVARRYITRAQRSGDEDHVELSEREFARRDAAGEFLFCWESHGFRYAVGNEILAWLRAGDDVIVNGSRGYLAAAQDICPQLTPVWITASEALLRARLGERGRESPQQIERRIRRNRELDQLYRPGDPCLYNGDSIDAVLEQLEALRAGA